MRERPHRQSPRRQQKTKKEFDRSVHRLYTKIHWHQRYSLTRISEMLIAWSKRIFFSILFLATTYFQFLGGGLEGCARHRPCCTFITYWTRAECVCVCVCQKLLERRFGHVIVVCCHHPIGQTSLTCIERERKLEGVSRVWLAGSRKFQTLVQPIYRESGPLPWASQPKFYSSFRLVCVCVRNLWQKFLFSLCVNRNIQKLLARSTREDGPNGAPIIRGATRKIRWRNNSVANIFKTPTIWGHVM